MKNIRRSMRRSGSLVATVAFTASLVAFSVFPAGTVNAATLTSRKVTLDSNNISGVTSDANGTAYAAGTFFNGSQTTHTFNFTVPTTGSVQGIVLQYCSNSPLANTACTAPTGLSVSGLSGTITSTGFGANTWTVDNTIDATAATGTDFFDNAGCTGAGVARQNCILLTQAAAASTTGPAAITLAIGNATNGWLTNPSAAGTFFVRVQLFSGTAFTNAQTSGRDSGAVAAEVYNSIEINSAVQETLNFSVGTTYVAPSTTCAAITGTGALGLGTLSGGAYVLSTTAESYANSYWRLSTNAANGVVVYYRGKSLENSAGNALTTSTTAWTPVAGVERFGLTLESSNVNHSFTNLAATAPYTSATQYAFDTTSTTIGTPEQIASAAAGTTVTCDTAAVEYVGSIATTTQPGLYKTNIIYYAVPTY